MIKETNNNEEFLLLWDKAIKEERSKMYQIINKEYFTDGLMQMEHEGKGWLDGISIDVSGTKFNLTFYTVERFSQDIEADLESQNIINLAEEYGKNILFVKSITVKNILDAIDVFVDGLELK